MAQGKPKTAWGKAFAARFRELKSAWDKGRLPAAGKSWKAAFAFIGARARAFADQRAPNPVATKTAPRPGRGQPKTAGARTPKRTGRVLAALEKLSARPGPAAKPARVELVKLHFAGGGELVNRGRGAATLRQDGSREVVSGGTWTPEHRHIGKARALREALVAGGARIKAVTLLVDGKPRRTARRGVARFVSGKLYLERV